MRNRRGQAVIESVLILALFFGITLLISNAFKQGEFLDSLVASPWRRMAGMIQNGVWLPVGASNTMHPAITDRHLSLRGDAP